MTDSIAPLRGTRRVFAAALLIGLFGLVHPAAAQLLSTEATATLTATLPESLTVSLTPGAVSFALTADNATNAGNVTLSATTTWTVAPSRTAVALYGYFSSATAALQHQDANNTVDIPSSRVEVSVNGGTASAFDQTVAFGGAGAGVEVFSEAITLGTNATASRTDTLALNINLAGFALPADTYTGTLRLRAQATP